MSLEYKILQNCRNRRVGIKYNTTTPTKEQKILYLLKTQPANIGMICAYSGANERSVKQYIYNLRNQGHKIKLESYQGFYVYGGS